MYNILVWKDHVTDAPRTYIIEQNPDGTITLQPAGEVIQQGTSQSASNFNNVEQGVFAANEMAAEAVRVSRLLQRAVEGLEGEQITVTLSNSLLYPFNNSKQTIPLTTTRNDKGYTVLVEVVSSEGGGVGEISISDKLLNGFKVEYSGAATSVTVNCYVQGGM